MTSFSSRAQSAPPALAGPCQVETDSHVASLLGMTENGCHCEEAQRANAAIRISRPAPRPPQGLNHSMPAPELPGLPRPRLPQGREPGRTAGTPLPSSVPRPTVLRKRAAKRPRPVPQKRKTPVRLRTGVSKGGPQPPFGRRRGLGAESKRPQNFSSGVWGCILSIRKEYTPSGSGPKPARRAPCPLGQGAKATDLHRQLPPPPQGAAHSAFVRS